MEALGRIDVTTLADRLRVADKAAAYPDSVLVPAMS